ncbi:hypothetical protein C5615_38015 [Burkholderia cepacia]|uniref:Serine protease n=1 Tax=Burkholderia cepacia TaxID=292 RepID=A0A2S8HXB0_BURCE|nr:serine protease [Burkholderia cepacia]PQP07214.1 hypothetical protein C5615_38015 [Burkholderia cepacia]HDR9512139.1 trypsin-like peptidase domain-containing protein [Burkholderia cepacia]
MINGTDNRIPAMQVLALDRQKFNHSMAVGEIIQNGTAKSQGTAFRVGPENRLMTNAHVFENIQDNPRGYSVRFQDQHGNTTTANIDRELARSPAAKNGLDYSLFTVNPQEFSSIKKFGHLEIDPEGAKPGQSIYLPQHSLQTGSDGRYRYDQKTIAISENPKDDPDPFFMFGRNKNYDERNPGRIQNVNPRDASWYYNPNSSEWENKENLTVQHNLDNTYGSSGAPVISSETNKVVALNNGDTTIYRPSSNRPEFTTNTASNTSDILNDLKSRYRPDVYQSIFARTENAPHQTEIAQQNTPERTPTMGANNENSDSQNAQWGLTGSENPSSQSTQTVGTTNGNSNPYNSQQVGATAGNPHPQSHPSASAYNAGSDFQNNAWWGNAGSGKPSSPSTPPASATTGNSRPENTQQVGTTNGISRPQAQTTTAQNGGPAHGESIFSNGQHRVYNENSRLWEYAYNPQVSRRANDTVWYKDQFMTQREASSQYDRARWVRA